MIIPVGISEGDWFDFTTFDLTGVGQLDRYEGDWKACASSWLRNPNLTAKKAPRPEAFDNFQEWASRFNQAVFG